MEEPVESEEVAYLPGFSDHFDPSKRSRVGPAEWNLGLPCSLYPQINLDNFRPAVGLPCRTCFSEHHHAEAQTTDQQSLSHGANRLTNMILANKPGYNEKNRFMTFSIFGGSFNYTNPTRRILRTERVKNSIVKAALQDLENDCGNPSALSQFLKCQKAKEVLHQNRAKKILSSMAASISTFLIWLTGIVLLKILSRLLNGIHFPKDQIARLRRTVKDKSVPVVYLPLHRSHLDYILLSLVLWMNDVRMPHVAAGDNLRLPIIGKFIQKFGGFFIKRKLDPIEGQRDLVYRSVLHTYMEELLKCGESLEFFIEAGRSRTGKTVMPKAGLLSVVIDAFLQGTIKDVLLVPVSISYDRIIDGNFCSELTVWKSYIGKPKVKESLLGMLKSFWAVLQCNYGSVRVDIGCPTSLQNYFEALHPLYPAKQRSRCPSSAAFLNSGPSSPHSPLSEQSSTASSNPIKVGLSTRRSVGSPPVHNLARRTSSKQFERQNSSSKNASSSSSLYGTANVIEDEHRSVVISICHHVLFDCNRITSIMSTQVVACLLMAKHRSGCRLNELVSDFDWMTKELFARGRDVGYNGDMMCCCVDAIHLLGSSLVSLDLSDVASVDSGVDLEHDERMHSRHNSGDTQDSSTRSRTGSSPLVVKRTTDFVATLELSYYHNPVISVFQLDAVVAAAICAGSPDPIESFSWPDDRELLMSRDQILSRALLLCDILQFEFLFCPPCASIDAVLENTIDQFVSKLLLYVCDRHVDSFFCSSSTCLPEESAVSSSTPISSKFAYADELNNEFRCVNFSASSGPQYKVNLCEDAASFFTFLVNMIGPLIESYHNTFVTTISYLQTNNNCGIKEQVLISHVYNVMYDKVSSGSAVFAESANTDSIRNCLKLMAQWRLIEFEYRSGSRLVSLDFPYSGDGDALQSTEKIFSDFYAIFRNHHC